MVTEAAKQDKPTSERILDAAEDLFAEKGYSATSLGDVADRVGIRSPSLYNHFKNKEALYSAVMDRLLAVFGEPLREISSGEVSREKIYSWLETMVRMHHERPNLARLLQHAALSGGPHASHELVQRLFKPMFEEGGAERVHFSGGLGPELQPWAVMALNNMVMSYVTMAPMYRDLLGQDPFGPEALDKQLELVMSVARLAIDGEEE
jgi:AcrR family transcriptional regulator